MEGDFFDALEQEGISPESSANEVEEAIRNLAKKLTIETTNVGKALQEAFTQINKHAQSCILKSLHDLPKNYIDTLIKFIEATAFQDPTVAKIAEVYEKIRGDEALNDQDIDTFMKDIRDRVNNLRVDVTENFGDHVGLSGASRDDETIEIFPIGIYFNSYFIYKAQQTPLVKQALKKSANEYIIFKRFVQKILVHTFVHEFTHILVPCNLEKKILTQVMIEKLRTQSPGLPDYAVTHHVDMMINDYLVNAWSHAATFKFTLLNLSQIPNSPIPIEKSFYTQIHSLIEQSSSLEFSTRTDPYTGEVYFESSLADQDVDEGAYGWEAPLYTNYLLSSMKTTPSRLVLSSQVEKKTNLLDAVDKAKERARARKNDALIDMRTFDSQKAMPKVMSLANESNLFKISFDGDAFDFLLQMYIFGSESPSEQMRVSPSEPGLYMYKDQTEIKFLYTHNSQSQLISLEAAWWLLSL